MWNCFVVSHVTMATPNGCLLETDVAVKCCGFLNGHVVFIHAAMLALVTSLLAFVVGKFVVLTDVGFAKHCASQWLFKDIAKSLTRLLGTPIADAVNCGHLFLSQGLSCFVV